MTGMMSPKLLLLLALTMPVALAPVQEPPEYPDGNFCDPRGTVNNQGRVIAPDHPCTCKRMVEPTKDDPACELGFIHEDQKCLQYCHYKHCACPVDCKMEGHHHP